MTINSDITFKLIIIFLIIVAALIIIGMILLLVMFKKNIHAMYQKSIEAELKSTLDSMPNLVFFNQIVKKELIRAFRNKKMVALLLIDIDEFNHIPKNIAPLLAQELGVRFSLAIRGSDVIAHYDNDKFLILLLDLDHHKFASSIADKLLKISAENFYIQDTTISIQISIGITVFPDDGLTFDELLIHAKKALHEAQITGGNCYQYYETQMNREAKAYSQIEHALRLALKNDEMKLYFQPQFHLKDRSIKSAEALLRWDNPQMGLVLPEKFIPIAEHNGMIVELGQWVLFEACRINQAWQNKGYTPIKISVNVSPHQFFEADILQTLNQALQTSGLAPEYLMLEITESVIMEDVDQAIILLNQIAQLGVEIAMDDFGTGYTSINYLKRFPLSQLKIDKTFIDGITTNSKDAAITSALVNLSHNLNLETVAEGVKTEEQLVFLIAQRCDIIQGDYISPAVPIDEFVKLINSKKSKRSKRSEKSK